MFVLNPCHRDARVRKEAASLGRAGFDVRVFALGNATWPEEVTDEGNFTIHRLEVVSVAERIIGGLGRFFNRPDRAFSKDTRPAATSRRHRVGPPDERRRPPDSGAEPWVTRVLLPAKYVVRRWLAVLHRPSVLRCFHDRASEEAIAWGADVAHAHDLNALPAAVRVAAARGVPVVYDSHELWRHRNRVKRFAPLAKAKDAITERRLIRHADAVITVGDQIASWLTATYGLPAGRVRRVRNVPERIQPAAGVPDLRSRTGIPDEAKILLYTGRQTTGRGIEDAIDALVGLPEVHLALLGYGDEGYVHGLVRRAAHAGVEARVHFVPAVAPDEVAVVASSADVAVVAIEPLCLSYRYASPNKLFEAIQGGVPVVASDLPEIGAIVRGHGVGELFPVGDTRGMADAIRTVLSDPARYADNLGKAAAELCWEVEEHVLLGVYDGLVRPRPSGTGAPRARAS